MTKALKNTNLEQNRKTNADHAAVSVEDENKRTSLMSLETSDFAFDFNKVKQRFLQVELACLRFANQSKGRLVLTPITLHLDNQAIQTLSATSRQTGKGIACILHKHLSSSFKYHLKRVPLFHLAFGVAYEKKGREVAKRENENLLYHVHITALLTPKESDNRTREGRKAHKACKCLNKLPKSSAFEKQECRFTTQSELETFQTQYSTYLQYGSRQRWSDYKASNVKSAIYRDRKAENNYFQKPSDLFAGSRGLKAPVNDNGMRIAPEIVTPPQSESLKRKIQELRKQLLEDNAIQPNVSSHNDDSNFNALSDVSPQQEIIETGGAPHKEAAKSEKAVLLELTEREKEDLLLTDGGFDAFMESSEAFAKFAIESRNKGGKVRSNHTATP